MLSLLWGILGVCGIITFADKFYRNISILFRSVPELVNIIKEMLS